MNHCKKCEALSIDHPLVTSQFRQLGSFRLEPISDFRINEHVNVGDLFIYVGFMKQTLLYIQQMLTCFFEDVIHLGYFVKFK